MNNTLFFLSIVSFFLIEISVKADMSIPISQPLTADSSKSYQGLLNNISSYPAIMIDSKTNQIVQIPVNRLSRYMLPADVITSAQISNLSILRPTDLSVYKNYPGGALLFPKNNNIAQQVDVMISAIQANQELIKFFRKIHLNCLNQMYIYFMNIYTNLMVRHVGSSRDQQGNLVVDLQGFLQDEKKYATNQKILIMSYLVNILELQLHAMILSCSPKTPYIYATPSGKVLIQNDFSIDLSVFASPQSSPAMQQIQSTYLDFLKKYLTFFKLHTNLLSQPDTATGFTQFTTVAQGIKNSSYATTMNPTMFFYDDESMRAIKMIPYLASQLPATTSSIDWAQDVVDAAIKGTVNNKYQVAALKDASNKVTQNKDQASYLSLFSSSGKNIYEEGLLKQPDWLNSSQGIIGMLQACLGDFSQIMSLNILDPFTQAIVETAVNGSVDQKTVNIVKDLSAGLTSTPVVSTTAPAVVDQAALDKAVADEAAAKKSVDEAASKSAGKAASAAAIAAKQTSVSVVSTSTISTPIDSQQSDKATADKAAANKAEAATKRGPQQ